MTNAPGRPERWLNDDVPLGLAKNGPGEGGLPDAFIRKPCLPEFVVHTDADDVFRQIAVGMGDRGVRERDRIAVHARE
jgi:hypothetical protein